jgi:hypothetical protein
LSTISTPINALVNFQQPIPLQPVVLQTNGLPNLVQIPQGYAPLNTYGMQLYNLAAWHLQRIGNTGILAAPPEPASTQAIGSIPNPAATQRRVWLDEPPGSIPFDEQGQLSLPLPQLGVVFTIFQFQVPQGLDGIIKWISNNVINNPTPYVPGSLIWQILINGRPSRNFQMIENEKGTIAQGRQISPIRLFSGDIVSYSVMQPIGSTISGQTVASLTGYYFPSKGIS